MHAIFMDLETSGLDCYLHCPLDVAFKIVEVDSGKELYTYQSLIKQTKEEWEKADPASLNFNGFTWEKIQKGKDKKDIKTEIVQIFTDFHIERGKDVFICQNPSFDRPFFSQILDVYTQEKMELPYHWLDLASMFWALEIKNGNRSSKRPPSEACLSKNAIAQYYQLPPEESPHSALNGVNHMLLCYNSVFDKPLRG